MKMGQKVDLGQVRRVKEGWLLKRGEHVKNWRPRFFVLFENGWLLGFTKRPHDGGVASPLNSFTVRGCQIVKTDKPKANTFVVRGLQLTTVIEPMFNAGSEREREEWCVVSGIQLVADKFKLEEHQPGAAADPAGAAHHHLAAMQDVLNQKKMAIGTST